MRQDSLREVEEGVDVVARSTVHASSSSSVIGPLSYAAALLETLRGGLLERAGVRTDDALVVFNWLEADYDAPPQHAHPFDQLALIMSGVLEFDLGDESFVVSSGEFLYIPAGVPHTARVLGDERVLNIDVFAPARADYAHLTSAQP